MSDKFNKGDTVRCVKISEGYAEPPELGRVYTVTDIKYDILQVQWREDGADRYESFYPIDFELADKTLAHFIKPEPDTRDLYVPIIKPAIYTCPYEEYNDLYNLEEP